MSIESTIKVFLVPVIVKRREERTPGQKEEGYCLVKLVRISLSRADSESGGHCRYKRKVVCTETCKNCELEDFPFLYGIKWVSVKSLPPSINS